MTKPYSDDSNREIEILSVALGMTEKSLMKILQSEGYDPFWELHTLVAIDLLKPYVGNKELKAFRKNRKIFDKVKRTLLKNRK
jgi:hypothetical protein